MGGREEWISSKFKRDGFNGKNGELRANDLTIVAIYTVIRLLDHGWVVAFLIEGRGKLKNLPWTELNTVAASFASILQDVDKAAGDLNFFSIQWNSPEFHALLLDP